MKRTTYTITEMKDLIGGDAYKKALEYIRDCTGITDEDNAIIEAEAFRQLFYRNGNPVH